MTDVKSLDLASRETGGIRAGVARVCASRAVLRTSEQERYVPLRRIVRGPGNYATPLAGGVDRLVQKGLVKKKRGALRPTLKGRLLALWAADK
jgi:hypothetical protein